MAFVDDAPNVSKVIDESTFTADFATTVVAPAPSVETLTDPQILTIYNGLKNIEDNNGYLGIARMAGCSEGKVKMIHEEIRRASAVILASK